MRERLGPEATNVVGYGHLGDGLYTINLFSDNLTLRSKDGTVG